MELERPYGMRADRRQGEYHTAALRPREPEMFGPVVVARIEETRGFIRALLATLGSVAEEAGAG